LQKTNKNLHLELPSLFYFFMLYKQKCSPPPNLQDTVTVESKRKSLDNCRDQGRQFKRVGGGSMVRRSHMLRWKRTVLWAHIQHNCCTAPFREVPVMSFFCQTQ